MKRPVLMTDHRLEITRTKPEKTHKMRRETAAACGIDKNHEDSNLSGKF